MRAIASILLGIIMTFGAVQLSHMPDGTGHADVDCPIGYVCPFLPGGSASHVTLPAPLMLMAAVVIGLAFVMRMAGAAPYAPPRFVFTNTGPPVILTTAKRE